MKALFIWTDGHRDYAEVSKDARQWDRFLYENPNNPDPRPDTRLFTEDPLIPKLRDFEPMRARFYRVDYEDESFEFMESSKYFEEMNR